MNETGGVVLIVVFVGVISLHGGDCVAVKRIRAAAAGIHDIAFVELEPHFTVDGLLGFGDERLNGLPLGGKPESVVDHGRIVGNEGVAHSLGFAIHGERLHVAVGGQNDRAAGGFIDTAALHAHKTVFDDVDAADAVQSAEMVEYEHDAQRVEQGVAVAFSPGFRVYLADDVGETVGLKADDVPFLKKTLKILGLVWGGFRGVGKHVHGTILFLRGVVPRVLKNACLVGNMQQIAIH